MKIANSVASSAKTKQEEVIIVVAEEKVLVQCMFELIDKKSSIEKPVATENKASAENIVTTDKNGSFGKLEVIKESGATSPSITSNALARAMSSGGLSSRSSSNSISSSSSRMLSLRNSASEVQPMNGASGCFVDESDQQLQLAEQVFPDDNDSEVKQFECYKKFHCRCCDDG